MISMMYRHLILTFTILSTQLGAWVDTGHMVVAEIARNNLRPEVQNNVDQLAELWSKYYPESSTFLTCGCWSDDIKKGGITAFDTWHYIDIPYDPEGFLTPEKRALIDADQNNNNVVWAIMQCLNTLSNAEAKPFEKAMMLRFLVHFVADAHQPLHCCSLFSVKYPTGDEGGNLYLLKNDKNLHKYWDTGLGMFEIYTRPLEPSSKRAIQNLARKCTDDYPKEKFPEMILMNQKPKDWTQESYEIAVKTVYSIKEGTEPSLDYNLKGRDVVRQRLR